MATNVRPYAAATVLGASTAALLVLGLRSLAPWSGTQLDVRLALLGCVLLGLAAGVGFGRRDGRPASASLGLLVAGVWLVPWPWVRAPLLRLLEPAGLPAATVFACVLLALVPALALGATFAALAADGGRTRTNAATALLGLLAVALVGAWAASAAIPLLVPRLGINRCLLGFALLQFAAAFLVRPTTGSRARTAAGVAVLLLALAAGAGALARAPACRPAPEFGLRFVAEQADTELRVLDRDEARYLLVDGAIVDVVDAATGSPLERAPAALRITDQLFAAPGRALVLGVRGGALAMQLARRGWTVTVVEPDRRKVEAAESECGLRPASVSLLVTEPRAFLQRAGARFDFVGVDLSGSGTLPAPWLTREFVAAVGRHLEPATGVLAIAVEAQGWEDALVRSLAATLRTEFPHVVALPTAEPPDQLGCVVLLAALRALELPDEALPDVRTTLGDEYLHWVTVQQTHAWFNRYQPSTAGARLLTDDRQPLELWGMRLDRAARRELHSYLGPHAQAW